MSNKHISIDSRKINKWMQTQVATSTRVKTRIKRTAAVVKSVAMDSNADSINEIAKELDELLTIYDPIHKRYVETNNQMLKTNKLATAANNVR
ncbi:hypothetical protein [Clostridium tertium]|uniref:hypothetical protein n=1 Tax=Clostridium tertium TaxID=1559 RepID=UPI0023B2ADD9|nr:hypothetical protein [Clostridium tertium]